MHGGFGSFVDMIPNPAFLLLHGLFFMIAAYFALRLFQAGESAIGWPFLLYAGGQISYFVYHLNITTIMFSHVLAEAMNFVAFLTLFFAFVRRIVVLRSR